MGAQLSAVQDFQDGVVTVGTRETRSSSAPGDTLLGQLQDIKEVTPILLTEKDFVWSDIKSAKALSSGNSVSAETARELLSTVKKWEQGCAKEIVERQSAVHDKIDVADLAAALAVKHATRAVEDMELLASQLAAVEMFPHTLDGLTHKIQELDQRLRRLTQKVTSPRWKPATSQLPSPFK